MACSISNGAMAGAALPPRLKVAAWGSNPSLAGDVKVSPRTAESLPQIHQAKRWDRIALDYEHNTLPDTPAFKASQEPRAVAAYGVPMVIAGDGLYLDDLQWTPHGEKFAREYCDLSPAPLLAKDGTVLALHSVALCRHGAIDGLSFYSAEIQPKRGDDRMNEWLRKLLGLEADATEEIISAKFQAHIKGLCAEAAQAAVTSAVAPIDERVTALSADATRTAGAVPAESPHLQTLTATVTALSAEVENIKVAGIQRERDDIVADAGRQGKIIPLSAEQVAAMDPALLRDMVGKLPVTVPIDRRTPANVKPLSADAQPSAALREVAAKCGIPIEKVIEANK